MKKDKFVFVDVETTGLTPRKDVILELGIKVTDDNLNVLREASWLVREAGWLSKLNDADQIVRDMHNKSGLVAEITALPENWRIENQIMSYSAPQVAFVAWTWLTEHVGLEAGIYPMAGSSVMLDRSFIREHMVLLDSFFSYRNIDVSSIKELAEVWHPNLRAEMKTMPEFQKANAKHRVLDDIDATIDELKYYRRHMLGQDILPIVGAQ